jgi:hypothetical protein
VHYLPKRIDSWLASVLDTLKTRGVDCARCHGLLREFAMRSDSLPFARDYSARIEPGALTPTHLELGLRLAAGGPVFQDFFRENYDLAGGRYSASCRDCGRAWVHSDIHPRHSAHGLLRIGFEPSPKRAAAAAHVAKTTTTSAFSAAERAHFMRRGIGTPPPGGGKSDR